jgi:16S rRNA (cytosine967-C5)-methyltransferase
LKTRVPSTKSRVSPARAAAFAILLRVEREASYASELLHAPSYENLSTRDHALATELVMGALRWQSRLDDELSAVSSQPLAKLDLEILVALRLALYQFRWLSRVPKHAALNESVELVKRARKRSAASFVNAVLRKLERVTPPAAPSKAVPSEEEWFTAEKLAHAFSHPRWLVERWAQAYGVAAANRICQHDQAIPPAAIRLRTATAEAQLREKGITWTAGRLLVSARCVEVGDITKTQACRARQCVIQDEASQLVALLVGSGARAGTKVLDCCAAPGGKTLAIADHNPHAAITAIELHPHRARLLKKLLNEAQACAHLRIVAADARSLPTSIAFDRVLVDVPCSGTGTLARHPEIKWRLKPDDLRDLQTRQVAILRSALDSLAPGGRLIYSTCSLEKEENEDVVQTVLAQDDSLRLVDCHSELARLKATGELTWPDQDSLARGPYLRTIPGVHLCDGFFAAIVEKA